MGIGRMWSPKTGWGNASEVLQQNELDLIDYKPKEGLTMINGTQFITALGAEGKIYYLKEEQLIYLY
jgi:histidine ammonia-lyase